MKTHEVMKKALAFTKYVYKKGGTATETHTRLKDAYAVAFNKIVGVGYHTGIEALDACVETAALGEALRNFKEGHSATMQGMDLSLQMGAINVPLPCINVALLDPVYPDPINHPVAAGINEGCVSVKRLIKQSETLLESTMLLGNGNLVVTDKKMLVEYWHGARIDRPVVIPKNAVDVLAKIKTPMRGVGYGDSRITFTFADNSWLRTQTYDYEFPDFGKYFAQPTHAVDLPALFFSAVKDLLPHADNEILYVLGSKLCTSPDGTGASASFDQTIIPYGKFNGRKMLYLAKDLNRIMGTADYSFTHFYGDKMRCAIDNSLDV